MNILVISASTRPNSQSLKVSNYLTARLEKLDQTTTILDLNEIDLPLYGQDDNDSNVQKLPELLRKQDGYIFVSPEWSGSMSAGLLNMIDYVDHEMAHKPVMLVGVSGTNGGAYPLSQMRQLGPKNTHYVISPENLIVRDVKNVMNDDRINEDAPDYRVKSRAEYSLKILIEYAKALEKIRSSSVVDQSMFPNGV